MVVLIIMPFAQDPSDFHIGAEGLD